MVRYIVRGFIDGLLSTLGVVIGASVAIGTGADAAQIIIAAGILGGLSNGFSNVLGAFEAEKAAVGKRKKEVGKAMLDEEALDGTKVDEKFQSKIVSSGVVDGLATVGGAIIPVIPFFFIAIFTFSALVALYISIAISLTVFFFLGAYVGKISKENVLLSGLKLVAFGGITVIVVSLLRLFF